MDDIMKKRVKELGEAINQSLSESEPIAEAITKIKSEGYDLFLVLEATIGFTRTDGEAEAPAAVGNGTRARAAEPKFRVTPQDVRLLKEMRIRVEE